mmetsp:Transcript_10252/g.14961  ORF Transcript_10252/g.14961 Transcript_10252/m.14961 type:complete len:213 (+) Transcript_10252:311-949(+)
MWIHDKVHHHLRPRMIVWNIIIVFGRQFAQLWQILSRYVRKVVMFIMISNIQGPPVEWAIITVRFLVFVHDEMFRHKMSSNRIELHSHERPDGEIGQTRKSISGINEQIKCNGRRIVGQFPHGNVLGIEKEWTERIPKRLKEEPNHLHDRIMMKNITLQLGRDIHIQHIFSHEFVMFHMVSFKGTCGRNSHRQVGHNGQNAIVPLCFGGQVV